MNFLFSLSYTLCMIPFRHHHALQILEAFDQELGPLSSFMHNYFRNNKALGSKDRREISELVYGIIRWQGLLDALSEGSPTNEKRLELFLKEDLLAERKELPAQIRASFPKELFDKMVASYGEKRALEIALSSNGQAPTTLRANTIKVSREELLEELRKEFAAEPCKLSDVGIQLKQRAALFSLPAFHSGYFEMQDEGSQLLANEVAIKPGDHLLDYCAGAGGKSLAIAPRMKGKGQLYLYDIRQHALLEAKKRMKRAGVQNVQFMHEKGLKRLKGNMDWVLVDAPCSGTGTLRRNPDMKWRFDSSFLENLLRLQREIVERATKFMKPKGSLVYATCSILAEENEEQIAYFEEHFNLKRVGTPFVSVPSDGEMDGFFAQRLIMNPPK